MTWKDPARFDAKNAHAVKRDVVVLEGTRTVCLYGRLLPLSYQLRSMAPRTVRFANSQIRVFHGISKGKGSCFGFRIICSSLKRLFLIVRRNVIDINNMTSNMTSLEAAMSPELN
jgi:hypothetical protein